IKSGCARRKKPSRGVGAIKKERCIGPRRDVYVIERNSRPCWRYSKGGVYSGVQCDGERPHHWINWSTSRLKTTCGKIDGFRYRRCLRASDTKGQSTPCSGKHSAQLRFHGSHPPVNLPPSTTTISGKAVCEETGACDID